MSKGGTGIGSASIVLIFASLCLTIFALISYSTARAEKAMADEEAALMRAYYEADTQAERILADILSSEELPASVHGVDIITSFDMEEGMDVTSFSCPVSDRKELYVELALFGASYDIRKWRMQDVGAWEADEGIPVWQGDDEEDGGFSLWTGGFPGMIND